MSNNILQPLTPVVFHVLLALDDGPKHGYAVMQSVARTAEGEPAMGPSTVYGCLARVAEAGLAATTTAPGRRSKLYRITPAGHRALWAESTRITRLAALVQDRQLVES